jgi:hypothetical protein
VPGLSRFQKVDVRSGCDAIVFAYRRRSIELSGIRRRTVDTQHRLRQGTPEGDRGMSISIDAKALTRLRTHDRISGDGSIGGGAGRGGQWPNFSLNL